MSGFTKKIMEFFGDDVEEDDDEVENDFEETKENTTQQPVKPQNKVFEKPQQEEKEQEKKVMSIFGVGSKKEESAKMSTTTTASKVSYVSIIRPKVFEDSRLIADSIKENKVVTFSLEFLEFEIGQRVIDFVSGAAYAMNAHLSKVTDKVLTSIPHGIEYEDIDTALEEEDKDNKLL